MADTEFNPDLAVVVRREFKTEGRMFQPGEHVDWKALGWNENRVAAMVRTRYLEHSNRPVSRIARKQAARLAEARKQERTGHAPTTTGRAKRAAAPVVAAPAKGRKKKVAAEPIGELTPEEQEAIRQMRAGKSAS